MIMLQNPNGHKLLTRIGKVSHVNQMIVCMSK